MNLGIGIIGELVEPLSEDVFFDLLKEKLNLRYLRHSEKINKKISKISIVVGSGSFAIKNSIDSNVDAFITSDLKYHNFFEADNNLVLVDIGHYESENHIKTRPAILRIGKITRPLKRSTAPRSFLITKPVSNKYVSEYPDFMAFL